MYIFISHSSTNHKVAKDICNLIEQCGWKCFLAPRDIRTGYEYAQQIMEGIERSNVMLLILSKEANASPHVLREVERAVSKNIPIIVYKLEEVELSKSMEYFLMTHQWVSAEPGVKYAEIIKCLDEFDDEELSADEQRIMDFIIAEKKAYNPTVLFFWIMGLAVVAVLIIYIRFRWLEAQEIRDEGAQISQESIQTAEPETDALSEATMQVEPGDTIVFGNYNGEPIEWRVLKLSEDGKEAVIVAKDILTMKAYDVAESGSYNYYNGKDYWGEDISGEAEAVQHQIRGNNDWAKSNIRTWLNATTENVVYEDQAPIQIAMSEYKNGYDKEPGFLSNFSKEEQAAILVTDVETNGKITQDKVFLLSSQELKWFAEADVSLPAKPTEAALEQDASNWYEVYVSGYDVEDHFWWLRDHAENGEDAAPYKVYLVSFSYTDNKVISEGVDGEGFGIRPAMTVDLAADCIKIK